MGGGGGYIYVCTCLSLGKWFHVNIVHSLTLSHRKVPEKIAYELYPKDTILYQ